jgi:conjugal transfer pilin signal peptidase TrbI
MIPQGKYFVWTPHIDSYDSRYDEIGLVDERTIIGVAYPLF